MNRSLLAASLSAALLLPASAGASTVSSTSRPSDIDLTTYQAAPGVADVTLTANNQWTDAAQTLTAGTGCTDLGTGTVSCPPTSDVVVNLRGGNDTFTNTFYWYKLFVHGNGGADTLSGNGNYTEIWGDGGADHIDVKANSPSVAHGGTGADEIRGGFPQGNGTSLDGGDGPDLVVGNSNQDSAVHGDAGNDELFSVRGVLSYLEGGANADVMVSLGTVDPAFLGTVNFQGGDGPDIIQGGPTVDVGDAGRGADIVNVYDGATEGVRRDKVACGPGIDTLYADTNDVINPDCETVVYGPAPDLPKVDAAKAHLAEAFPDTPQSYTP
jgi:Ca2+-binding RTX toxin-like protein